MSTLPRLLVRTGPGQEAWRDPTTQEEERRLLGTLSRPQPERSLRIVLGDRADILISALLRRGWVEWQAAVPEKPAASPSPAAPSPSPSSAHTDETLPPAVPRVSPTPDPAAPAETRPGPGKPAPVVSPEEAAASLEAFFRFMDGPPKGT